MTELPPELLALVPLALAAGIDLYLTLLLLGAAPTTPWWDHPLPGALGDLDSPGVLIMVGVFYVLEFSAERSPPTALVWNAFHAIIRPLAGALLALLLLDGQPLALSVGGAVLTGAVASFTHAARSGEAIVRWLGSSSSPGTLPVSLLEDSLVLGIVTLSLDAPTWALAAGAALLAASSFAAPSQLRAFEFAVRLAAARVFRTLTQRRWMSSEELPVWVREALEGDLFAPGGGLRGSPAGALRLPGAPRFSTGWVVIRGSSPVFLFKRRRGPTAIDLGPLVAERVEDTGFYRRVDLGAGDTTACVFFGTDGPSKESLRAEFLFD